MKTSFELKGAAEMERALGELGEDIAAKAGRSAIRAAAKELRDDLKQTAPYRPGERMRRGKDFGHLRDNLRVRFEKSRKPYTIRFVVTIGRAFWGYFQERGTVNMGAKPWAAPTFERKTTQLLNIVLDTLRKRAAAAARRQARQKSKMGHNGGPALED